MHLYLIFWFVRLVVALRYRIKITGRKELIAKKWPHTGGILFLPNHAAEMDPIILMMVLWREFRPRPLAADTFYYQKGIRFFMDLVRTLAIPDMDIANQWKIKRLEKSKQQLLTHLRAGDNFLIYPSGKLKRTAEEKIGGAFLVHDLLQAAPDTNIALIRITGFWGSLFSCAATPTSPDFGKTLWRGFKILLKNGIFFAPRRAIHIEMSPAPDDFPYRTSRLQLNQYLERWYNARGPEPLSLVRYYFWSQQLPKIEPKHKQREQISVPPELEKTIIAHLAQTTHRGEETIQKTMHLSNDLGLDSLDIADLYIFLEDKFQISDLEPGEIQTVEDLIFAAANYKKEREKQVEVKKRKMRWPKEKNRLTPLYPEGHSIQEVFLNICNRMGSFTACADGLTGPISYRKLKRVVLVLALKIKQFPEENIGILLPSTIAAYLMTLATMLAKKVPVMLNWTAGSRALEHCVSVTELHTILSSFRFLNHLDNADFGETDDLLLLLEEFRKEIGLGIKLKGLLLSLLPPKALLSVLHLNTVQEKERAVIIFTSGTETLPKGVPLSHKNLLSNERAAFSCIQLDGTDSIYSVLPPFHSFGLSVTGLLPLLIGLKTFYAPDPTHSHGMANDIAKWKPTMFCCAPSFIRALFKVASNEELQSIRLFVSGAEKAPEELFDRVKQLGPDKKMIEGYGISECSPIVTIGRPEKEHKGVGQAIPGVELCVIHPDTREVLPQGQEGEICIYGPNVFEGYLGYPKSPFITLQGKSWYRSGDRGYLDSDGTLFITGRLKRFFKIGGEMVSLGGLEEELLSLCEEKGWAPQKQEGPKLAIVGVGLESDKPIIVLFTTFDIGLEQVNGALRERGLGRIVKISRIQKLDEIPLTGTGKTHYRLLEEKVAGETKTL
ncbi:MAG TPA: AMP-binding protein [Rhabdochlamydiaceae bacterium]|nr:AMP-binding protein [Rhabdochlamydiaceae bacterium]